MLFYCGKEILARFLLFHLLSKLTLLSNGSDVLKNCLH